MLQTEMKISQVMIIITDNSIVDKIYTDLYSGNFANKLKFVFQKFCSYRYFHILSSFVFFRF